MPESFVPLARLIRGEEEKRLEAACEPVGRAETQAPSAPLGVAERPSVAEPLAGLERELMLLRLATVEAFERARDGMLERLARDVLGRELAIAPADVQALVERLLLDFAAEVPIGIALSAADAAGVRTQLPIRIDPSLEPGDVVIEVRDGVIDARIALRLCGAIAAAAETTTA